MTIKVYREFIPMYPSYDEWELTPFNRLVWEYNSMTELVSVVSDKSPDHYLQGKLFARVNDVKVSPSELDELLLEKMGFTRDSILHQIRIKTNELTDNL